MKNLKLVEIKKYLLDDLTINSSICQNASSKSILNVTPEKIELLNSDDDDVEYFPEIHLCDHDVHTECIISAQMIYALNAMCVITREGDVITINTEDYEVEIVGSVEDGIKAAKWSPDEEILILVTGADNFIVMTGNFNIVNELSLNQDDTNEFINVGWGKKETQFHGSLGKEAAKQKSDVVSSLLTWDDRKPKISWRGDGTFFAISHVTSDKCRKIKIFNREGILQNTSENIIGLEHTLCWKPSGSLITTSQMLPNKHQIVFFERNGLRHGEFTLPFKVNEVMVKEVIWNNDSSVLLLFLEEIGDSKKHFIQLWTTSNYHWYLKQEFRFKEIFHVQWDSTNSLKFYIFLPNCFYKLTMIDTVSYSRGTTLSDLAQVAVIDGKKVNFTPFAQAVVPPPMCCHEVSFPETVNSIIYAPDSHNNSDILDKSNLVEDSGFLETIEPPGKNSNNVCIFHGENNFTFLSISHANDTLSDSNCIVKMNEIGLTSKTLAHRVIGQYKLQYEESLLSDRIFLELYNWLWVSKDTMLATHIQNQSSKICVISLENIGSDTGELSLKHIIPSEKTIISMSKAFGGSLLIAQMSDGQLYKIDLDNKSLTPWKNNDNEPCVTMSRICKHIMIGSLNSSEVYHPIGLTFHNQLLWAGLQLASNCTSLHYYQDHILFTTLGHELKIVPLDIKILEMLAKNNPEALRYIGSRKIERGARIVTAISEKSSVILQMPRGNLEAVTPRLLLVHQIKRLLSQLKYKKAVELMRKHRIDMNLIYDHSPEDFIKNIELFVKDVNNPQYIDLFIATLSENDVTSTFYSVNYTDKIDNVKIVKNKLDSVCVAIRSAMKSVDSDKFLLPILTSHVKMTKSEMDVAIKIIQEMKASHNKNADEGLRHLLYIVDANTLFNVALGTYDFDLALMVFEKTQLDPKEIFPFLNDLKGLEENYCKFKIDIHLRKFEKALLNIKPVCDLYFGECLKLIKKENLYKSALRIFTPESKIHQATALEYAEHLLNKNAFEEAAIMFNKAGDFSGALESYEMGGNWKMVICTAFKLQYNQNELTDLYCTLISSLQQKQFYKDAACIYETYLMREEDAVENFIKGEEWSDALRIIYKHKRLDLIETNIKPSIFEHLEYYKTSIEEKSSLFTEHYERLFKIRDEIEKMSNDIADGVYEDNIDCDLYSESSTVTGISHHKSNISRSITASSKSTKSHRSSKSKRKLERKKYSTKEGSAFEDLGLVTSLHSIMMDVDKIVPLVSSLLCIALSFNIYEEAKEVQQKLKDVISLIENKQKSIWLLQPINDDESQSNFGPNMSTQNMIDLMQGKNQSNQSIISLRIKQLEPYLQFPPLMTKSKESWSFSILSD